MRFDQTRSSPNPVVVTATDLLHTAVPLSSSPISRWSLRLSRFAVDVAVVETPLLSDPRPPVRRQERRPSAAIF